MKYNIPLIKSLGEVSRGCSTGDCCNGKPTEPEHPIER